MAARRFLFLRWWWLGCVMSVTPLPAQERPQEDAERAPVPPRQSGKPAPPAPEKPAPSTTREFKPSEEVSPDQEVDFPADL